jgi:hypothetical protein
MRARLRTAVRAEDRFEIAVWSRTGRGVAITAVRLVVAQEVVDPGAPLGGTCVWVRTARIAAAVPRAPGALGIRVCHALPRVRSARTLARARRRIGRACDRDTGAFACRIAGPRGRAREGSHVSLARERAVQGMTVGPYARDGRRRRRRRTRGARRLGRRTTRLRRTTVGLEANRHD